MSSMYSKRKSKEKVVESVVQMTNPIIDHPKDETASKKTSIEYTGYDIFSPDSGGHFFIAELKYDPSTGEARVTDTYEVSRLIGLQFAGQKTALGIIKKTKRQTPRSPE